MRKVFLDNLPRWQKGEGRGNAGKINWSKCIGYEIPFVYDDIEGGVMILDYEKKKHNLKIKYNDDIYYIKTDNLKRGKLGRITGVRTKMYKIDIGETINDNRRSLIITNREYRYKEQSPDKKGRVYIKNEKWYKYKCLKCGYESWIIEGSLIGNKSGCSCCENQVIVPEINSIWKTDTWMIKYIGIDNAKKYSSCSNQRITAFCPDCGFKKEIIINNIYKNKGISCTCNNKTSYPEKILYSIMKQLGVEFKTQLSKSTFDWIGEKRYDFYVPSFNMIIETHGLQHYEENSNFKLSLQEEQKNDKIKEQIAKENGIKHYIIIDCRHSDLNWIKESILNSKLNDLFDLSKVDWNKCEEFALKNVVKEVCEYWNNKEEWETTGTIANNNKWGINSSSTIRQYLTKGKRLGWVNYDSQEEYKKVRKLNRSGKTVEIFSNDISLGIFESCAELERQSEKLFGTKLSSKRISAVCTGEREAYKGFTFKYKN